MNLVDAKPPNHSMQRAALRAAADAERSAELQTRTARLHFPMSVKLSL